MEILKEEKDQAVTIILNNDGLPYRLEVERELKIEEYLDINKVFKEEDFQTLYFVVREGKIQLIRRKRIINL